MTHQQNTTSSTILDMVVVIRSRYIKLNTLNCINNISAVIEMQVYITQQTFLFNVVESDTFYTKFTET